MVCCAARSTALLLLASFTTFSIVSAQSPGTRGLAGYVTADGTQHVLAAAGDGGLYETFFSASRGITSDLLSCQANGSFLAGYATPWDNMQHAVVAEPSGAVTEWFFDSSIGIHRSQPALDNFDQIAGVAAYATPQDRMQHVIVATENGEIHEVFFSPSTDAHRSSPALATIPGIVAIAAYVTTDGTQHVIAGDKAGRVFEVFFSPTIGSHVTQPPLAQFDGLVDVAAYVTSDGTQHVIAATADGGIHEIFFSAAMGIHVTSPALVTLPGVVRIAAYATNDNVQHVIVGTRDGQIHEVFFSPATGVHVTQPELTTLAGVGVARVEITQAIQDLNNRIPLFRGKRTLVRVYPSAGCSSSGPAIDNLAISAAVFRASDPNTPVWGPVVIGPASIPRSIDRDSLSQTLNFELPSAIWSVAGTYLLRVTTNPCSNLSDNPASCARRLSVAGETKTTTFRVYDAVPLHVQMVYAQDTLGHTVPDSTMQQLFTRWRVMYPVPLVLHDTHMTVPPNTFSWPWVTNTLAAWQAEADALPAGQEPIHCASCRVAGILTDCPPNWCGLAPLGGIGSVSAVFSDNIVGGTGTVAQEVGHDLGRQHAGTVHGGDLPDPNYPHDHGEISPIATETVAPNIVIKGRYYGADPGTDPADRLTWWRIIPSAMGSNSHPHDFMSYGGGIIWTGWYTYLALCSADVFGSMDSWYSKAADFPAGALPSSDVCPSIPGTDTGQPQASGHAQPVDVITIGGTIRGDSVSFEPGFRYMIRRDAKILRPLAGEYAVQLRNLSGRILGEAKFNRWTHHTEGDIQFAVTLPWNDSLSSIVVVHGHQTLGTMTRPKGGPSVRLGVMPQGAVERPVQMTWTARVPGGRPVRSAVSFSSDGGRSWGTIATELAESSFNLDPALLAGTRMGRLRISASDGFATVSADAAGNLIVQAKPPTIAIEEAQSGLMAGPGGRLVVHARAFSPQEGTINDESIEWIFGGKVIARGRSVELRGLPSGSQEIQVRATDRAGLTSTVSARISLDPASIAVTGDAAGQVIPSIGSR